MSRTLKSFELERGTRLGSFPLGEALVAFLARGPAPTYEGVTPSSRLSENRFSPRLLFFGRPETARFVYLLESLLVYCVCSAGHYRDPGYCDLEVLHRFATVTFCCVLVYAESVCAFPTSKLTNASTTVGPVFFFTLFRGTTSSHRRYNPSPRMKRPMESSSLPQRSGQRR